MSMEQDLDPKDKPLQLSHNAPKILNISENLASYVSSDQESPPVARWAEIQKSKYSFIRSQLDKKRRFGKLRGDNLQKL